MSPIRLLSASLLLALTGLAACHTVEGAGRDVSATGRAVTSTAQQATPR